MAPTCRVPTTSEPTDSTRGARCGRQSRRDASGPALRRGSNPGGLGRSRSASPRPREVLRRPRVALPAAPAQLPIGERGKVARCCCLLPFGGTCLGGTWTRKFPPVCSSWCIPVATMTGRSIRRTACGSRTEVGGSNRALPLLEFLEWSGARARGEPQSRATPSRSGRSLARRGARLGQPDPPAGDVVARWRSFELVFELLLQSSRVGVGLAATRGVLAEPDRFTSHGSSRDVQQPRPARREGGDRRSRSASRSGEAWAHP